MNVLALSLVVVVVPSVIADAEVRTKRQMDGEVVDSIFNIPITAIRLTSEAAQQFSPEKSRAIATIFQIPLSTLEAVSNLVKQTSSRRRSEGQNLQRLRRDIDGNYSNEEEEGRTFHHLKKKKRKFHHHQKPSQYGFFGQPIVFPGHYMRPPAWKPPHAVPQFVNIFNQGSHGSHGHQKPFHKPHGSHTPGQYQVWEDTHEEWPNLWSSGFFGLGPQYPTSFQNKVAPRNVREYRSYTTGPRLYDRNVETTSSKENLKKEIPILKKDKIKFKN